MLTSVEYQQFLLLFKGKSNSYVRNELPKEAGKGNEKIKTKITQQQGEVDKALIAEHLEGNFGVGICPVTTEGKCHFGVIDIDCYDSRIKKMFAYIKDYALPFVPARSKSGGLHCYIFFSRAMKASSARELLSEIVQIFCLEDLFGKGKVEIFPKQNKVEEDGFGSCITLPYFNAEETYTPFLNLDEEAIPVKQAVSFAQKQMTTQENLKEVLSNLPYSDAPPCLQRLLLSSLIGSEDSGRNNFLFSFAVYAKKKYGSGYETYVEKLNASFECPLEETIVEQLCSSVSANEYYYRCKEVPCSAYCNKVLCKNREFGLGRDKSHFTGIEYGELRRYLAAEPYYEWLLRLHGQATWKKVIFKDESYLLDQKNFQKACVRYLNTAPMKVSDNDWYTILNSVLPNIVDIAVKKETDTSGLSELQSAFVAYLANKQARRDSPFQIRIGLCVRKKIDGEIKYFFTSKGFSEYLRNKHIPFEYTTLRETLKNFGASEDTLYYENALGSTIKYPCWSKKEDTEITDMFIADMDIETKDKGEYIQSVSVSEIDNTEEETESAEKAYTQEDFEAAQEIF